MTVNLSVLLSVYKLSFVFSFFSFTKNIHLKNFRYGYFRATRMLCTVLAAHKCTKLRYFCLLLDSVFSHIYPYREDTYARKQFIALKEVPNGWLYWGLMPLKQLRSYHGGRWRPCVSWISHTSTDTTFLSKAADYFSHMLLQRWEVKIRRKESLP